jgi:phasin family protein
MAKISLHKATREQLIESAGLRPKVAEAILKVRDERGGEIADIGALKDRLSEVKGIGPASLDKLGNVLRVSRQAAKPAAEKPADTAAPAAKASTEDASRPTEAAASGVKVAGQTAEETAKVIASGVQAGTEEARRTAEKTAEVTSLVARGSVEATSGLVDAEKAAVAHSSKAASELSQFVARLLNEQVQANIEMLQTLARARTWREALEAQTEFFRGNIERMTSGTSRYVETVARLTTGLAGAGRGKEKRAA